MYLGEMSMITWLVYLVTLEFILKLYENSRLILDPGLNLYWDKNMFYLCLNRVIIYHIF